jgi:hypothetical protein
MENATKAEASEILDPTKICNSFPETYGIQIKRENILHSLETTLGSETYILTIEGCEGMGKTTLLAQFASKNCNNCASVFVKPNSRITHDPNFLLADICNQIHWILRGEEYPPTLEVDDTLLRRLILELSRRAARLNRKFYFVLDGLEDIPKEGASVQRLMIGMMPLGLQRFRFLFSGTADEVLPHLRGRVAHKSFILPPFTFEDTLAYFSDLNLPRELLEELYRVCKGVPGYLASIRRIIEAGTPVESLVDQLPETIPELFEIEWKTVDRDNENQQSILALIAHDKKKRSVKELADVLNLDSESIRILLAPLRFIKLATREGDEIEFVSDAFRRFASTRLAKWREPIRLRLIDYLLERKDSNDALSFLPTFLQEAGRLDELLDYLSPDHFAAMIERSQSLLPVQQKAELGLESALRLGNDGDLLRFGIQKSTLTGLDACGTLRSEIEARMALNEYQSAMALAQSAVLRQDRLRMLAVVARLQREQGFVPDSEVLEQIDVLFKEVDHSEFGDRRVEVATDLMYSKPELAIQLVEKRIPSAPDDHTVDWGLVRLSIVAAVERNRQESGMVSRADDIRLRIKDQQAFRVSTAVSLIAGRYSAREVIAEIEKLPSAVDRLFLLRQWALHADSSHEVADVLQYALNLAIRTTEYTPHAAHLRELATPLPFVADHDRARELVSVFDAQKGTVERLGPTEDYVRLQLTLAETEAVYNVEAAANRLVETYLNVSDQKDLDLKTACTARIIAAIPLIDPNLVNKDCADVQESVLGEFEDNVTNLLNSTADHYLVTRGLIEALAPIHYDLAFRVIKSINTEPRRDLALLDLVKHAPDEPLDRIPVPFIQKVLDAFADRELQDEALVVVLKKIADSPDEKMLCDKIGTFVPLMGRISAINDGLNRVKACCFAIKALSRSESAEFKGVLNKLKGVLQQTWESMDDGWRKVDAGFRIATNLAPYVREVGKDYLAAADRLNQNFGEDYASFGYTSCLRLAMRAYSGLLPKRFDLTDDFKAIADRIDRVKAESTRVFLWTDVALRSVRSDRISDAKRVVAGHIKPLLDQIGSRSSGDLAHAVTTSAPALYVWHKATALELIGVLPSQLRDVAWSRITNFILTTVSPSDPYGESDAPAHYHLTFDSALEICELLPHFNSDTLTYITIRNLVDSAIWRNNEFSQQQKADLAYRLVRVVDAKFPNQRFIVHEGYKILGKAQINRLKKSSYSWEELITAGRNIPNLSDKVFVMAYLAEAQTTANPADRVALLKEAKGFADLIPSVLDRVDRYNILAKTSCDVDPALCKECIREAMKAVSHSDDPEAEPARKKVVDFAHRIDPELASSLASSLDDDSARAQVRERIELLELKKKMAEGSLQEPTVDPRRAHRVSAAAWKLLGALNAARIAPLRVAEMRQFIRFAAARPMSEAYPILSWVIENAIQRRAHADEARGLLRKLFEATLVGSDLSFSIAGKKTSRPRPIYADFNGKVATSVLVRSGERDRALQFLRDWLETRAAEYLKICDPFWGPNDLEVFRLVLDCSPKLKVSVLTSKKHQDQEKVIPPWEDTYRRSWALQYSDQNPPENEIVIVGARSSGELPIHDRWWVTKGAGIRLGTSFSSIGGKKDSEISTMDEQEARQKEAEIDQFLTFDRREYNGEKLSWSVFSL